MQLHREPTQPPWQEGGFQDRRRGFWLFCINGLTFAAIENGYYCNVKF